MKTAKTKKGAFFFKYFFIFSAIVLVSFLVIGISLMLFVASFFSSQTLKETQQNAYELAKATTELVSSDTVKTNSEAVALLMCQNVELLASTTDSDVYICNINGQIEICPETTDNLRYDFSSQCEIHEKIQIPTTYIQRVKNGRVTEFTTLGSSYDTYHSVSMEPFYMNDSYYGFCVVASPVTGVFLSGLKEVFILFMVSAAIALVLVTVAVYFMTGKIAKPIRNLETATTLYASGDFSYRVPEINSNDELAHLITRFNAMATSLSQIENSRRSFVANVSHEFKTPMTTIGGFINGILDGTIPPEKQDYYLSIVSSEIDRLSRMVNMMLNISKIETGNVEMNIESFDLSQKLLTTFLGFEQLISKKNIEIVGMEDLKPAVVHGDSAMIDQVIYNLVDNAVKFTDKDGKIIVNTANDKKFVYLAVTNTGEGIPPESLEKVFDRFYKVDQSRSTDTKSTGLGLYLIKSILSLHNGTITVESEADSFTRFTVKLPK